MTTEHVTCESVQDALITGDASDVHHQHVTSCPTCGGVIAMIRTIRDQVEPVPALPGQRPQWIADVHRRARRRRTRVLWGASSLATAAVAVAAIYVGHPSRTISADAKPAVVSRTLGSASIRPRETEPARAGRPAWITSDAPFTGSCTGVAPISCIGISSYRSSRDDAQNEAREVAFDALDVVVGERIHSDFFERHVRPAYEATRTALLGDYAALAMEHDGPTSDPRYRRLADARHRAAVALLADASAVVPTAPAGWYWEEFANDNGVGTSFVAYVRFDLDIAQLDRLTEIYSIEREHESPRVVTAFPLLAFVFADFQGGSITADEVGPSSAVEGLRRALRSK